MRFDVITLFPELFVAFLATGVTRRAFRSGQVDVQFSNPRDFSDGKYRRVDDRPFGGGPGMVMMAEPLQRCLAQVRASRVDKPPVLLFSPHGKRLRQDVVQRWAVGGGAILLCGRYEGIDQRFVDAEVDEEISLGDFVLSGGEVAAMALLDAVARLQPGVLTGADSHAQDSFSPAVHGLLDCPHYTHPQVWQGVPIPSVLLSGNHALLASWRRQQSLTLTRDLRPDLINLARTAGLLTDEDEKHLREAAPRVDAVIPQV
jgi:tRNA (guanine37-N1)-methyltransferase